MIVGGEESSGGLAGLVVPDRCGEGRHPGDDADDDAYGSASAVSFQVELGWLIDSMVWRSGLNNGAGW